MRMRKKAWARPELDACPYFIKNPQELKGNWSNWFPKKTAASFRTWLRKGCLFIRAGSKASGYQLYWN